MRIRPATDVDAPALAALEAAAAWHPWSAAALRGTLGLATTRAWLTELEGAVVAHLVATVVVDEGEILTVAVHPGHQRHGLGAALVRTALAAWRAEGVVRGFLEVRRDNTPARALYAALGWTESGVRRDYYGLGEDAVAMRWQPTS